MSEANDKRERSAASVTKSHTEERFSLYLHSKLTCLIFSASAELHSLLLLIFVLKKHKARQRLFLLFTFKTFSEL